MGQTEKTSSTYGYDPTEEYTLIQEFGSGIVTQ
jgi:hypothetical protein